MSRPSRIDQQRLDPGLLRASGALLGAHVALGAAIDRLAVAPTGHDPTTIDLLVRLDLAPDRRLRGVDLCRQLQLSASHVSRTIDRVEAAGLVTRSSDPGDRRAQLIGLTRAGERVVAEYAPRLHGVLAEIVVRTLSADEIQTLVHLLGRIERASLQALEHEGAATAPT